MLRLALRLVQPCSVAFSHCRVRAPRWWSRMARRNEAPHQNIRVHVPQRSERHLLIHGFFHSL